MAIYLYVGRHADPFFIFEIFKCNDFAHIDKEISEDEIFENVAESQYLNALCNIINGIRYQRQAFCEVQVILEGEIDSEQAVSAMCILDENCNPRYRIDYHKFLAKVTGPVQSV